MYVCISSLEALPDFLCLGSDWCWSSWRDSLTFWYCSIWQSSAITSNYIFLIDSASTKFYHPFEPFSPFSITQTFGFEKSLPSPQSFNLDIFSRFTPSEAIKHVEFLGDIFFIFYFIWQDNQSGVSFKKKDFPPFPFLCFVAPLILHSPSSDA